jgi:hypothetical protein
VDEGEILALLLVDAGEPRRRRTTGIHGGDQTLGRGDLCRARENLVVERRGRPVESAEVRRRRRENTRTRRIRRR